MHQPSEDANSTKSRSPFYWPELDGLRFFAFLLVFIHHAPRINLPVLGQLHDIGWIGVDIFFALSAYLFVMILRKEYQRKGRINLLLFYTRRLLRIWPLYMVFCLAMIWVTLNQGAVTHTSLGWRFIGLLTFSDNLMAAFKGYNPIAYSAHLWTIAYEEQFYLVIPLLLSYLLGSQASHVTKLLIGLAVVGLSARAVMIWLAIPHPAIWVLPVSHFESILLGIAVGLGAFDAIFSRLPVMAPIILLGACLWMLLMLPPISTISWHLMSTYILVGLISSLALYVVCRTNRLIWMNFLQSKTLVFLGKISYGLYVFHFLGLAIGRYVVVNWLSVQNGFSHFLISLTITVMLAIISFTLLERPFLKLKKRFEIVHSRPA